MQFAQILGSPELKGVNTGGDFAAYAIASPHQMKPTIKVLVPVSDYAEFLNGNPNVSEPDENGVSKLTMNGRTLAVVMQAGHYALFAEPDDSVTFAVDTGIQTAMDAAEKTIATGQPLWAYVNIQKVNEVYGQVAVAQLEKAKTMLADTKARVELELAEHEMRRAELDANDPNQTEAIEQLDCQIASTKETITQLDNNPMMGKMDSIMDMYIRIVQTLLTESKSFSLALAPEADVLTILETYTAMPGSASAMALVASTSPAKADKLVNYLQDGAMLNFACRLNKPLLQELYSNMICLLGVMTDGAMSEEDITKMQEMTTDIIDSLGDAAALSLWADETASPPFLEDCIIEVSDEEKFNKAVLEGIELWNDSRLMDFYKDMDLEMNYVTQMNLYEYKGAKVNSATLTFKAQDPNTQQAQMIKQMYGDGFEYRWALIDGLCVEAIAGDVDAAIKQLIDEVKAGGASEPASDIKQAVTLLGDGADDFFGTFNIVRLLKLISAIPSFPITDITVDSKSNIAFGGKIADGKVVLKVAVPKTHVSEVVSIFMPKPPAQ